MNTRRLTQSQETLLAFLVKRRGEQGRPPSLPEIRDECRLASLEDVLRELQALARKGLVVSQGDGRTWSPQVSEVQSYFFPISG